MHGATWRRGAYLIANVALLLQIENSMQVLTEEDVPRNMQGQPNAVKIMAVERGPDVTNGQ